jgi:hypothetical protein
MQLVVSGKVAGTWANIGKTARGGLQEMRYRVTSKITNKQIQIRFTNDACAWNAITRKCNGEDRNLRVDRIVIDGITYATSSVSVYKQGVKQGNSCANGTFLTSWLDCNGYFQY